MADSYKKKQHENAYVEGVHGACESDALSQAAHNMNPFSPATTTEKSREAGWRDYWDGKVKTIDEKPERQEQQTSKSKSSSRHDRIGNRYATGETARTGGSLERSGSFVAPKARPPAKVGMLILGILFTVGGLAQMFMGTANPPFEAPKFWMGLGLFLLAWRLYIRRSR